MWVKTIRRRENVFLVEEDVWVRRSLLDVDVPLFIQNQVSTDFVCPANWVMAL